MLTRVPMDTTNIWLGVRPTRAPFTDPVLPVPAWNARTARMALSVLLLLSAAGASSMSVCVFAAIVVLLWLKAL